ncbi:LacI family DNA-binding transcriptional regulator [Glaciibacter superstes]|uniref:LacI family DNA-binding transcriptional regulator n=1 Tax=Glaciibacter superstes TaxID=501023 RepID=UPI0003B58474|nr:LacI family DNA-binding transcriptional regulator [Glaciibacter superstes]
MVTSRDVAREAGVSQSTVSYVMSGKRPLSDDTLRRVDEAMTRLGYQPNSRARALAAKRSHVVGLMIPLSPRIEAASLMRFIQVIASEARGHGHDILLVTEDEGASGMQRVIGEQICDGLILMQVETDDERIPVVRDLKVPVVVIGVPGDAESITCVDADYRSAAELAVDFLAARGHRQVTFVDWPSGLRQRDVNFIERFDAGVAAAAQRSGIEVLQVEGGAHRETIGRAVRSGLEASNYPAFLVPDSGVQAMLQESLMLEGRRPGLDVSLIGSGEDAPQQIVPLTTIDFVPNVVSARAVELLVAGLDGRRELDGQVHLEVPTITERESTIVVPT